MLVWMAAQQAEARLAPVAQPMPEGPVEAGSTGPPPPLARGRTPAPVPPARPQPSPPVELAGAAPGEGEAERLRKQRRRPVEQPPEAPPAPAASEEHHEEPFDPQVRQNVFGQRVTEKWDAEKIINTDRPDFTDVLPVVGKGVWQSESGISFRHKIGADYRLNRISAPETLIRLGLTRSFELRVRWDTYAFTARQGAAVPGGASYGSLFQLGFKWQAVRQAGWAPGHTFLGTLTYLAGNGRGPAATGIQPGLNWCYGWQINKYWVLRGSTGFEAFVKVPQKDEVDVPGGGSSDPEDTVTQGKATLELHQSVVSYVQVAERLGMYYEWFAFWYYGHERGVQHNGGVGAYVYITPNIQLDARFGGSLNGLPHEVFVGGGISFRGGYDKKKGSRAIMR